MFDAMGGGGGGGVLGGGGSSQAFELLWGSTIRAPPLHPQSTSDLRAGAPPYTESLQSFSGHQVYYMMPHQTPPPTRNTPGVQCCGGVGGWRCSIKAGGVPCGTPGAKHHVVSATCCCWSWLFTDSEGGSDPVVLHQGIKRGRGRGEGGAANADLGAGATVLLQLHQRDLPRPVTVVDIEAVPEDLLPVVPVQQLPEGPADLVRVDEAAAVVIKLAEEAVDQLVPSDPHGLARLLEVDDVQDPGVASVLQEMLPDGPQVVDRLQRRAVGWGGGRDWGGGEGIDEQGAGPPMPVGLATAALQGLVGDVTLRFGGGRGREEGG